MPEYDKPSQNAIVRALHKAIRGTPLSLFAKLTPLTDASTEQVNGMLDDDTPVVFQRRSIAVQRTEALHRAEDGSGRPLRDGTYRLKDGVTFTVVDGLIDFDAVFKDPDGVEPFRQYHAWKEVVAIDNPLLSLPSPLEITDVVRFLGSDGRFFHAVQWGANKPYQAYIVEDHTLKHLEDGEYPLPTGGRFRVTAGAVHPDSLANLKLAAHESTRLPS